MHSGGLTERYWVLAIGYAVACRVGAVAAMSSPAMLSRVRLVFTPVFTRSMLGLLKLSGQTRGTILRSFRRLDRMDRETPERESQGNMRNLVSQDTKESFIVDFWQHSGLVRRVFASVCLAVSMLAASPASAQTLAVVSVEPTDEIVSDVRYLMRATGTEAFSQMVLPPLQAFFQGIDGKQRIGVVLSLDESKELQTLGFVPVTDLDTVLQQLSGQLGEPQALGDGVLELQGPQPLFVKEQNGWAFLAQSVDGLQKLPQNPAQLLEGIDKEYLLGVRLNISNLPPAYREMLSTQLREFLTQQMSGQENVETTIETQMKEVDQLLEEADTMTLGLNVDAKGRAIHFDASLNAQPGTKMAKQIAGLKDTKTRFGGFLVEGAAVRGNFAGDLLPEEMDDLLVGINQGKAEIFKEIEGNDGLDDVTQAKAKELVETLMKVATGVVKSGRMDAAMSVVLKPEAMTLVAASSVADGAELEAAVKQMVELARAQEEVSLKSVKFNAGEHAGVRFHTIELTVPEDEYVKRIFGDSLQVVVGAAKDAGYVAIGNNGMQYLKQMIDASRQSESTSVLPMEFVVAMQPILDFAKSIEPNPIVETLAEMLANKGGKDHFRISVSGAGEGVLYRLTLEEGVLSLIGQGAVLGSQAAFQ